MDNKIDCLYHINACDDSIDAIDNKSDSIDHTDDGISTHIS